METKKELKKVKKENKELQTTVDSMRDQLRVLAPKSKVNFRLNTYLLNEKSVLDNNFFGISNDMTDFEKRTNIDNRIKQTIENYGITKFDGKSLYDFTILSDLRRSIVIIENGLYCYYAQEENISKIKDAQICFYDLVKEYVKDSDVDMATLLSQARKTATSQEEYDDLIFTFTSYMKKNLLYRKLSEEIRKTITQYGIDFYIKTKLYDITDINVYKEAMRAIPKIYQLRKEYGIVSYKGTPIEELSEYEIDGILLNCGKKDFSDCALTHNPKTTSGSEQKKLKAKMTA